MPGRLQQRRRLAGGRDPSAGEDRNAFLRGEICMQIFLLIKINNMMFLLIEIYNKIFILIKNNNMIYLLHVNNKIFLLIEIYYILCYFCLLRLLLF